MITLTLNGLYGPITVLEDEYPGLVPMTPFRALLNDEEIAAVLTYVRNAFGNKASPISPESVHAIREKTKDNPAFRTPKNLLERFPLEAIQ